MAQLIRILLTFLIFPFAVYVLPFMERMIPFR